MVVQHGRIWIVAIVAVSVVGLRVLGFVQHESALFLIGIVPGLIGLTVNHYYARINVRVMDSFTIFGFGCMVEVLYFFGLVFLSPASVGQWLHSIPLAADAAVVFLPGSVVGGLLGYWIRRKGHGPVMSL